MQKTNYTSWQQKVPLFKSMLILLLFSIFMFAKTATATHYRYGNISWSRTNDVTRTVTFTVNMSFRKSYYSTATLGGTVNTGIPLLFGDGTSSTINLLVTSVNLAEDWFYGTYTVTKTYTGTATAFTASFTSCCRISNLQNNNDQTFGSQSFVKLLPGSTSAPLSTMPPIINLAIGNPAANFTIPAFDPDGTALTYALATATEAANGTSMIHPVGLSVNNTTGIGTFNTVGKTVGQLYNTAVTITDASGAKTVVDFMIRMVATSTPPVFNYAITPLNAAVYSINPGQNISFNLSANDVDLGDNVTMSVVGLASGMTFSPVLPTSGNPVNTSFSWTPTTAQLGAFILNFTAQDIVGTQTQTSVTINVNMNPIFVAPTPTLNSERYVEIGNSISDNIAATNPNPLVNTQILSSNLPSGAVLTNSLPTAFASTSTTTMNWTPTTSNWGVNTFTYVANDANGKTASHSYEIVANSTPAFTSTPITTAIVNQLYSYTITASDADLLFGDDLEIENHNPSVMPAWLTFTDNGNGTATLSGTPTMADLGSSNLEFLAADIYHHDHADVEQIFTLNVIGVAPSISNCPQTQYQQIYTDANSCTANFSYNPTIAGIPTPDVTYTFTGATTGSGTGTGSGSAFNTGQTTVTINVANAIGSTSCSFVVTVIDNVLPTALTQNKTVYLDATGQASIIPSDVDNGSTDNCGPVTLSLQNSGTICGQAAENQNVYLQAPSGTVITNIDFASYGTPNGSCGNYSLGWCHSSSSISQVGNYALGNNSAVIPASNWLFGDPCGGTVKRLYVQATYSGGNTQTNTFNCTKLGNNNVILNVTDANGNVSTGNAIVTVLDTIKPTISCQSNINAYATYASGAFINYMIPSSTDNCSSTLSLIAGLPSGSLFPIGTTTVTYRATDASGNFAECSFDVNVTGIAPQIVCPANISLSASAGNCSEIANYLATENTAIPASTISYSIPSGSSFSVGTIQVTATATNAVGSSSCTFDVTVIDNENPSIVCPASITLTADANTCGSSNVLLGSASASDNCAIATVTNNAPAFYPVGTTTVTWTALDIHGNSSTCTQDVTVTDNENPSIVCPTSITLTADANTCGSSNVLLGSASASDNCAIATVTNNAPAFYPVGTTTVTWTALDIHGNSSTCTQDVTVTDNENPSIVCPASITLTADANTCGSSNVLLGSASASDNCAIATVTNNAPAFYPVGTTTVTWTALDIHGNSSTCTQDVTVTDNENPSIVCPTSITLTADANTCGSSNVLLGSASASDNCAIATVTNNAPAFYPVGTTTVTWTALDIHGNSSTCTQDVTVTDNENPSIVCPASITLTADANTCGSSNVLLGSASASDNCAIATVTNNAPAFYPVGTTTVTWTALDIHGNSSTCTQDVTVTDNENPSIVCPASITLTADANTCGSSNVLLGSASASDNCAIATVTNNAPAFYPVGTTTVTWTALDIHGNSSTCTQDVTVTDNENPSIVCPASITLTADANTCGSSNVLLGSASASDNCAIATVTNNAPAFYPVGTTTVTWTALDIHGNSSTCTQDVTVTDNENPSIVCPASITLTADANTCGSSNVLLGSASASDNCAIATVTNNAPAFYPVGTTTVTWTALDIHGNSSTCTQDVTVTDNENPNAVCQNYSLNLLNGLATITAADLNNGSTDNCGISSLAISQSNFDCSNVGSNTIVFTVTDIHGNSSTCNSVVTVNDNTAPVAICKNATVTLSNGIATVGSIDINNNSTDECGIASYTLSQSNFDCTMIGANPVIMTVTDVNGNSSSCTSNVVVVGTIPTMSITEDLLPDFCTGQYKILTANSSDATSFVWNTTETSNPINVSTSGIYSVIGTNVYGCTNAASINTNVNLQSLTSSYVIIAKKEMKLQNNSTVYNGGVGVTTAGKSAKVLANSKVIAAGTFVKATNITVSGNSTVTNKTFSNAVVSLPTFYPNTLTNNTTTNIPNNANITLNGSNYGKINIGTNATVTFTNADVNIRELKSNNNAKIKFNGCTNLHIKYDMELGDNNKFNVAGHKVTVYVGSVSTSGHCGSHSNYGDVEIGKGDSVFANIYAPYGEIEVEGDGDNDDDDDDHHGNCNSNYNSYTVLKGQFIAEEFEAKSTKVYWNDFCTPCAGMKSNNSDDENLLATISEMNVSVYPNPSSNVFTVSIESDNTQNCEMKIIDMTGRVIDTLQNLEPNHKYIIGNDLSIGNYILSIKQGDKMQTVKFVKVN